MLATLKYLEREHMSIKIIKNTMTEPIEKTCSECGSVISFTYGDIQRKPVYNFLGMEMAEKRFIVCPVCKGDIDFTPIVKLESEGKE